MKTLWPILITESLPEHNKPVTWQMDGGCTIYGWLDERAGKTWVYDEDDNSWAITDFTHWYSESMPPELAKVLEFMKTFEGDCLVISKEYRDILLKYL